MIPERPTLQQRVCKSVEDCAFRFKRGVFTSVGPFPHHNSINTALVEPSVIGFQRQSAVRTRQTSHDAHSPVAIALYLPQRHCQRWQCGDNITRTSPELVLL